MSVDGVVEKIVSAAACSALPAFVAGKFARFGVDSDRASAIAWFIVSSKSFVLYFVARVC